MTRIEANYVLACQYMNSASPAYGAINDITGDPTFVVPRENGMAILGLKMAAEILRDNSYIERAQLAADYLTLIQDQSDGSWFDQYDFTTPVANGKSPTQTAEVMIAFYKLGFRPERYVSMRAGAQYLLDCQNPANKGGIDDGLLGGGKYRQNDQWLYHSHRWASDNSYAYWALKAAQHWAILENELDFAQTCQIAAQNILNGINQYLYVNDPSDPDHGVWRAKIDSQGQPVDPNFHEWINYAPQMLDLPAVGVGSARVGTWIHQNLQNTDGACVQDNGDLQNHKSPGFSFQASLCWLDLRQRNYSASALGWTYRSGLWQRTPDPNGIAGGWVDWIADGVPENWWWRFIDTSFYAIAAYNGGYDFRTYTDTDLIPASFSRRSSAN